MSDWNSDDKPEWGDEPAAAPQSGKRGKPNLPPETGRDWKLIEKLVLSLQSEQRKSRRWGIFFKFLTFGYLFLLVLLFRFPLGDSLEATTGKHTALVEINGLIAADELASADNIVGSLRKAFEADNSVAVVLRINSGGGSPVQSGYVYDEIQRLRGEYPD
ncbi:MAG: S49 family peptidase, partial [Marinobacter sp.]|nr:S49 family peptidase [Marinobacter sp.]